MLTTRGFLRLPQSTSADDGLVLDEFGPQQTGPRLGSIADRNREAAWRHVVGSGCSGSHKSLYSVCRLPTASGSTISSPKAPISAWMVRAAGTVSRDDHSQGSIWGHPQISLATGQVDPCLIRLIIKTRIGRRRTEFQSCTEDGEHRNGSIWGHPQISLATGQVDPCLIRLIIKTRIGRRRTEFQSCTEDGEHRNGTAESRGGRGRG